MKTTTRLTFVIAASLAITSCGNKPNEKEGQDSEPVVEYITSDNGDNIRRYESVSLSGDISYHGHSYKYTIKGEPCDSLPLITDTDNARYADNIFNITITRNGEPFVSETISKATLKHMLSTEFQQKGILDGIVYDSRQEGLRFCVSVSFPESDVHTPLLLHIGSDGSIRYEQDCEEE